MLKDELEKRFFPYVIKPGRYAGGEPGSVVKNHSGKTSFCYASPAKYESLQPSPNLHLIYNAINKDNRFVCERTFAVDTDAEKILRNENLPLFSLETCVDLKIFDVIGFNLQDELQYTEMLRMLDLAHIPIHSLNRDDTSPIIIAFGDAIDNPEPITDFVDIFLIGAAEKELFEILELIHEQQCLSKKEKLLTIAQKNQSVYLPALHNTKETDSIPKKIIECTQPDLNLDRLTEHRIIPLIEIDSEQLIIDTNKIIDTNSSLLTLEKISESIENQVRNSGVDVVRLLTQDSKIENKIENLISSLSRKLEKERISVSLSALSPTSITPKLLDALKRVRMPKITIVPEVGSERLRKFIRQDFQNDTVYQAAELIFEKGWTTLNLLFKIGYPTETTKDLDAIVDMIQNISQLSTKTLGRKQIKVSIEPFVPKAHTIFQWDEIVSSHEILERILYIKKKIRTNNVTFNYPELKLSLLRGILKRCNSEMGKVIESVYKNEKPKDSWHEEFDFSVWESAFKNNNISYKELLKPIPFSKKLPWSHIETSVISEQLQFERQKTSKQLQEIRTEKRNKVHIENNLTKIKFGRAKKKIVSKQTFAPTKNRVRFRWGKDERYKYMGHLDNLRLIEKVLRKSKLPILYSQGQHPMMKLSFGPPLSLGFTSESEFMDITFDSNFMPQMVETLNNSLPDGIRLYDSKIVFTKNKSISALMNRAIYSIDINKIENIESLTQKINDLLARDTIEVERKKKEESIIIDLRPAIYTIELVKNKLFFTLGIGEGGYAKPGEVLKELLGETFQDYYMNSFHRLELYREDDNGQKISAMEL